MSRDALSGLAAGLVFLSLAASMPSMAKAPPSPPGPARPASRKAVIRPVPEAPGHYLLQQNRADTLFTGTGLALRLTPAGGPARELHWGLAGARAVTPQPLEPREARFHQFVGPAEKWKRDLPTWGALYYPGVAPGVDLWFEARDEGVAYSLRAERGADLRQVRLEWRGAQELRLTDGGRALEVVLADGLLREEGLLCGQESADGTSFGVPCRYRDVRPKGPGLWEYVIEVDVKEPGRPVWVDPALNWNTFLGGSDSEEIQGLVIQDGYTSQGSSFIIGSTKSTSVDPGGAAYFPYGNPGSMSDVVVTRFTNRGAVEWTAVLGGSMDDFGTAIAIGVDDTLYLAGYTASNDFPKGTSRGAAPQLPFHGPTDGFVARLGKDGDVLHWVQLLGGGMDDQIRSLVLGSGTGGPAAMKVFVSGWTKSGDMPGSDTGVSKNKDLFVSRINYLTGAVEKTLVRRGSGHEEAVGMAAESPQPADGGTLLYVTGYTTSGDFPVGTGSPPVADTEGTALVFKLNHELADAPLWEHFLGGESLDQSNGLVVTSGHVTIVGTTRAPGFVTMDGTVPVGMDAFLASFNTQTGEKVLATVVGGPGNDEGLAIAPGTFESFYVGGKTNSPTLPAVDGGIDLSSSGGNEGFVIRMGREGSRLVPEWGTFVGGSQHDEVRALAAGFSPPLLVVAGISGSERLVRPTTVDVGAKTYNSGEDDMFLFSMDALDLTPPKGQVRDGLGLTDEDTTSSTTTVEANWDIDDLETGVQRIDVSVGTAPGCEDVKAFSPAKNPDFVLLSSTDGGIPALTAGRWYFVNVRATNDAGLSSTLSSNGIFVLQPDGGPASLPERPTQPGCGSGPDQPGEGGGGGGGGEHPLPLSPLGWSCGTPGGPTGLAALVVVAFGLLSARRKARRSS